MGSMIHLAVGRLQIDWGKNRGFTDHNALYQLSDIAEVPYYYVKDIDNIKNGSWEVIVEYNEGLSKPLHQVIDRINLLGYTLAYSQQEFSYISDRYSFGSKNPTFEYLRNIIAKLDLTPLSLSEGKGIDVEEFFTTDLFSSIEFDNVEDRDSYDVSDCLNAIRNLSAYTFLHLLSANLFARNLSVDWAFNDLAENGWANRSYFTRPLDRSNKFLIVTEGSSDAAIIKKSFVLLKSQVSDFFDFVDMQEGYPFAGTGNLVNFVKGLISISIQNDIIVLFDNDAAGVYGLNQCLKLNIPPNMQILKLPNHTEFERFNTVGPNGYHIADINGQGAAIECYLDLDDSGCVRWNNYNTTLKVYQGELIEKDKYKRAFLSQTEIMADYDYKKLLAVLDMIIANSIAIREKALVQSLDEELDNI